MIRRFLEWLVDDERLKPRAERGVHPIKQDPPPADVAGLVTYTFHLLCLTALLWDQVWWMNLPLWKRAVYWYLGHRAPITRFYPLPSEPPSGR